MLQEVILGSKDPSVIGCQDIWSLGCVLFELYTGKRASSLPLRKYPLLHELTRTFCFAI